MSSAQLKYRLDLRELDSIFFENLPGPEERWIGETESNNLHHQFVHLLQAENI